MRVLVVVPTYNEALNVATIVERILRGSADADVLIADDGSPDGTADVVRSLISRHGSRVSLSLHESKAGRGAAVMRGFRLGLHDRRYTHFAEMDADLSHSPDELPRLLRLTERADVAVASRYILGSEIRGCAWHRRVWSRSSNAVIHAVLRLPLSDYTNGFRVYRRAAVERLATAPLRERGFIALSEWAMVLHRSGFRFADAPTVFVDRQRGKSNMSVSEALGALRALMRLARLR